MATKVKDLCIEYKTDFIGLQERMRKKYSDKFFRLIDPHQQFAWKTTQDGEHFAIVF
jgi:hypothetical protein